MSNYVQTTFFAPKDALITGNPLKLIKGADVDPEFAAIAAAIATKFDSSSISSAPVGFSDGTAAAPGITFASQTNMGFFRAGNNDLGITVAGVKVVDLVPTSILFFGSAIVGTANISVTNTSTTIGQDTQQQWNAGSSQGVILVANQNRASAVLTGGPTTAQFAISTTGAIPLVFGTANTYAGQINGTGNWIIAAPGSGVPLTVNGLGAGAGLGLFTVASNASATLDVSNTNAGTAGKATLRVLNSTDSVQMGITSTGYTGAAVWTNGPPGEAAHFGSVGAIPLSLGVNGIEFARIASNGTVNINSPASSNTLVVTQNNNSAGVVINGSNAEGLRLNGTAANGTFMQIYNGATFNGFMGAALQEFTGTTATDFAIGAASGKFLYLGVGSASATLKIGGLTSPTIQGYGPVAAGFVDMTPDTGTFTMTFTGFTAVITGTAVWSRVGNLVALLIPSVTGTSNAVTFTATGLPAAIQPARAQIVAMAADLSLVDLGSNLVNPGASFAAASGTITFYKSGVSNTWSNSGAKGTNGGALPNIIYYILN